MLVQTTTAATRAASHKVRAPRSNPNPNPCKGHPSLCPSAEAASDPAFTVSRQAARSQTVEIAMTQVVMWSQLYLRLSNHQRCRSGPATCHLGGFCWRPCLIKQILDSIERDYG
jgi:hypothetical protein